MRLDYIVQEEWHHKYLEYLPDINFSYPTIVLFTRDKRYPKKFNNKSKYRILKTGSSPNHIIGLKIACVGILVNGKLMPYPIENKDENSYILKFHKQTTDYYVTKTSDGIWVFTLDKTKATIFSSKYEALWENKVRWDNKAKAVLTSSK